MFYFSILCVILKVFEIETLDVEKYIKEYFENENFEAFQKQWQKYRKSYENAIELALKENYGSQGVNVYVRNSPTSQKISSGFYIRDDYAEAALHDMFLGNLPKLIMPEITFALASNVLRLESELSKLFIHTQYNSFHNVKSKTSGSYSLFQRHGVQEKGRLTIVGDGCKLIGYAIVSLHGQSVNLGHDTFMVTGCKFSFEMSAFGVQSPPDIHPFFHPGHATMFEKLISKPLREELLPKLQSMLLTYINTTVIFYENLPKYRQRQQKLLKVISDRFTMATRTLNRITAEKKQGAIDVERFHMKNKILRNNEDKLVEIMLKDITIYGLDTLYSGHTGGPFKLDYLIIGENFRYNLMQVQGTYVFKNDSVNIEEPFVGEISDVTFNVEVQLPKRYLLVDFIGWRSMEFSIKGFNGTEDDRTVAESIITGQIINTLPSLLTNHILQGFLTVLGGGSQKLTYIEQSEIKEELKTDTDNTDTEKEKDLNDARRKRKIRMKKVFIDLIKKRRS